MRLHIVNRRLSSVLDNSKSLSQICLYHVSVFSLPLKNRLKTPSHASFVSRFLFHIFLFFFGTLWIISSYLSSLQLLNLLLNLSTKFKISTVVLFNSRISFLTLPKFMVSVFPSYMLFLYLLEYTKRRFRIYV